MNRKLASIQRITALHPIPDADRILRADVLGWHCVVGRDEFKEGDLCVYFEVDSLLPDRPEFEAFKKFNYHIETVRLRGQISQGLCMRLETFGIQDVCEGKDVSDLLGVTKWEYEIPENLKGRAKGALPSLIPKTEESRIQNEPWILEKYRGTLVIATEKLDGESSTFYNLSGDLGLCSHHVDYLDTPENGDNVVYKAWHQLELRRVMERHPNLSLQGEIVGPGVKKNKYKLSELDVFFFNGYDTSNGKYLCHERLRDLLDLENLKMVPVVGEFRLDHTVDQMVEFAQDFSVVRTDMPREGIVVRPVEEMMDPTFGRVSFKVISPKFQLKYKE